MTKVYCDLTNCEYCRKDGVESFICTSDIIELSDEQCLTYGSHVEMSEEYRESYWKRLASKVDRHECREECTTGKRYEMMGLTWFTDQDDRWGTEEIWFTEQRSGLRIMGKSINEKNASAIIEKINSIVPVKSLPIATAEDLY